MKKKKTLNQKIRSLIAWTTALSVIMGSTYFAFAEEETYCGYPASYSHAAHTDIDGDCYDMEKVTCDGNGCYELVCTKVPLHGHSDDCYEKELKCGVSEEAMAHEHDDATCENMVPDYDDLICADAHEHDAACPEDCDDDHHTDGCYGQKCAVLPEGHGNAHTEACYDVKKICGFDYDHVKHNFSCFALRDAAEEHEGDCYKPVLTCEKDEHTHTAICFVPEEERQAALDVKAAIEALTTESERVGVENARFNYDALNEKQQAVVDEAGLDVKLEALEINLAIAALPELEAAVGSDLYKAKQLRDRLGELDKDEDFDADLVPNKDTKLATYDETLNDAEAVIDAIEGLPAADKYSNKHKAAVEEAHAAYTDLDANERELVKLVNAEYVTKLYDLVKKAVDVYQVASDQVPNATVKLFNYTGLQPATDNPVVEQMHFVQPANRHPAGTVIDDGETKLSNGKTSESCIVPKDYFTVQDALIYNHRMPILQYAADNYPAAKDEDNPSDNTVYSMKSLFDGTASWEEYTMYNGGGLFKLNDRGNYYYDSTENAAAYNKDKNEFELYNVVVLPKHRTDISVLDICRGCLLPFNPISSELIEKYVDPETTDDPKAADPSEVKRLDDTYNNLTERLYRLSEPTDLAFGMTVEFEFFMPEGGQINGRDMIFDFRGDDDVVVYIDGYPVMDLFATHAALDGDIDFTAGIVNDKPAKNPADYGTATGNVSRTRGFEDIFPMEMLQATGDGGYRLKDNTVHTFKFFFMERGGDVSNCLVEFNMPTVPEHSLTIGKEVKVEDHTNGLALAEELASTLEYKFRVLDENGEVLVKDTNYKVLDEKTYEVIRTGRVYADNDQTIALHPGELAQIEDMSVFAGGSLDTVYYVEELIPSNLDDQYEGVDIIADGTSGTITKETETLSGFVGYRSDAMTTGDALAVTYTNNVDVDSLGALQITKTATDDSWSIFEREFEFEVRLNGEKLSNDIQYTVNDGSAPKNISKDGTIKLKKGQTATIDGIMAGTDYEVKEVKVSGFTPTYFTVEEVTVTRPGGEAGATEEYTETKTVMVNGDSVAGTLGLEETVSVTVENESKEFEVPVSLQKTAEGIKANEEFEFYFDVVEVNAAGEEIEAQFEMEEAVENDNYGVTVEDNRITVPFNGPEYTPSVEPDCTCEELKADALEEAQKAENDLAEAEDREPVEITEVDMILAANGHVAECAVASYVPSKEPIPAAMSAPMELIFRFNENTENGIHYFKVTEYIPEKDDADAHFDRFVYDDTVYIVAISIDHTARGERAKFVSLTADGKAVEGVTSDTLPLVDFTNRTPKNKDNDDTYLTVRKVWKDGNDKEGKRPESITVKLLKDGKEYDEVEVTRMAGWTYTWSDLDEDYTWTVEEMDKVPGYDNTSTEMSASGHTVVITNTIDTDKDPKDPTDPVDPTKDPSDPKKPEDGGDVLGASDAMAPKDKEEDAMVAGVAETGDSNHAAAAAAVMAAALAGILMLRKKKEN